jgi:ATP-dependent exoDNAse (exonuclease V) alpha subunit
MSGPKTRRKPLSLEEQQEAANALQRKWAAALPERERIAREVAEQEDRETADAAIRFHEQHGVYPWDLPRNTAQEQLAAWMRAGGTDMDAMDEEIKERMTKLVEKRVRELACGRAI